jgi:hypothetical protein
MKSMQEKGRSVQPWEVEQFGKRRSLPPLVLAPVHVRNHIFTDNGVFISTIPEDVTRALQAYLNETSNDRLAVRIHTSFYANSQLFSHQAYLGEEGQQRFIQYQSKIMSGVAGAFSYLSSKHYVSTNVSAYFHAIDMQLNSSDRLLVNLSRST